jgi:hypothetical protein
VTDWKRTSRFLSDMAHKYGVGLSTPSAENGFGLVGVQGFLPVGGLERRFDRLTPKGIRRWLWDVRYDPVWREHDVLVYVERESPTSWVGQVGRVGSPDAEEAIVFTEAA